jgi:hypothetical protein
MTAMLTAGCNHRDPLSSPPGVRVDGLAFLDQDTLVGTSVTGGIASVWTYDVPDAHFEVLKSDVIGTLTVNPVSPPNEVLLMGLGDNSENFGLNYYRVRQLDDEEPALIEFNYRAISLSKDWPARLLGIVGDGAWLITDDYTPEGESVYALWNADDLTVVSTTPIGNRLVARFMSPPFGPDKNYCVLFQSGSGVSRDDGLFASVLRIQPIDLVLSVQLSVRPFRCVPGPDPNSLISLSYKRWGSLRFTKLRIVVEEKGVRIEESPYDYVHVEFPPVSGGAVDWAGLRKAYPVFGPLAWFKPMPARIVVAESPRGFAGSSAFAPLDIRSEAWAFGLDRDGSALAMWDGGDEFSVYAIDLPRLDEVVRARIEYGSDILPTLRTVRIRE